MQRVKELREKLGWSQEELAEMAGLKKETIAKIESGKRNPRPATRGKLAYALGCSMAELEVQPHVAKPKTYIQALREKRGWSQNDLVRMTGLDKGLIVNIDVC